MNYSKENPWIKKREACVCLWKPDYIRGYISNMNTSLIIDFSCFSDKQFEEYALMMKACGYTGVQVTDMCSAWRPSASPEFFHDRLRVFADALHRNGMEFTLWCWAAEFCNHGWHDDEVAYASEDENIPAREDEKVLATFNKYYDIYAQAAPFCDRVIAHYYDPGNLPTMDDVIFFLRMFADKFKAANPNVQIGVDTWGSPAEFPDRLVEAGFDDIMLMELPFLPIWKEEGKRARFREGVKALGCELGSWGWYTCEYETDQRPYMSVNNRVLADVYKSTIEQADHIMIPSYWSEMDAYHVLNFFSMYASGHLLENPEADPDVLLAESAALVAGKRAADDLLYVLELIRDARSGDTWGSYWWQDDDFGLRHTNAEEIYSRAVKASELLAALVDEKINEAEIPFVLKPWQLFKLMQPQVEQIKEFAKFRIGFAEMEKIYEEKGVCDAVLQKMKELSVPVHEYNSIVGVWGQPEAMEQIKMLKEFGKKAGVEVPRNKIRDFIFKRRLYDYISVFQRAHKERVWKDKAFYEGGYALGEDEISYLADEMIKEGLLVENSEGKVAMADIEDLIYDFNI